MKLGTLDRTQAGCCSPLLPHIPSATAAHHCSLQPAAADGLLPCMACSLPTRGSGAKWEGVKHSNYPWPPQHPDGNAIGYMLRDRKSNRTVQLYPADRAEFGNAQQQLLALESAFLVTQQGEHACPVHRMHGMNFYVGGRGARPIVAQASHAPPHLAMHLRTPHLALPNPSRLAPRIASQAPHGVTTY